LVSIPSEFTRLLHGLPTWPLFLVLLVISLLLIFFGRAVVRVLAFLVVGLIGATAGGMLVTHYLPGLGTLGSLLGLLVGFIVGGLIGLLLVPLGIGLVVGYATYLLTLDVVSNKTAALVVAVVFLIIGALLYKKILTIVTAVAGGFLLFDALGFYLSPTFAAAIAVVITVAGLWINLARGRREPVPKQ
jgi:hypothetical protein